MSRSPDDVTLRLLLDTSRPAALDSRDERDLEQVVLQHPLKEMRIRAAQLLLESSSGRLIADRLTQQLDEAEVIEALRWRPPAIPSPGPGDLIGPTKDVRITKRHHRP